MRILALGALLVLAGCITPSAPTATLESAALDPAAAPGALDVQLLPYAFGIEVFDDERGMRLPMHLRGSLHLPEGEGPFPVLVFVHGYHGTCSYPLLPQLDWYWGNSTPGPLGGCPEARPIVEPADSFRGYDFFSGALASHGYAVASIDAGELNDNWIAYDWTLRAKLVLRTLDHLETSEWKDRLDLDRVGIMGHSRGGQGVNTALEMNLARPADERHGILAVFGLAPVDATSESTLLEGAAYATLLPYCDGDVWNLAGARTFDRARFLDDGFPKYQFLVMGSNHNYYNTMWARNSNDAGWMTDDFCGKPAPEGGFLALDDVLLHGGHIMSAFFRAHVGGEAQFLPFLRGDAPLPPEACPTVAVDCEAILHVSYHPPAPDRLVVEDALTRDALTTNDLGGASALDGFAASRWCRAEDCETGFRSGEAPALHLAWTSPSTYAMTFPAQDVSSFRTLSFRIGVDFLDARNPADAPQDLRLVLQDARGREASARVLDHSLATYAPPAQGDGSGNREGVLFFGWRGDENGRLVLNEVRVPLSAFEGVALEEITSLSLVFDQTESGAVLLTDVMLTR